MNGLEYLVFDERILDGDVHSANLQSRESLGEPNCGVLAERHPEQDDRTRARKKQGDRFIPLRTTISALPRGGILLDKENVGEKANQEPRLSEENYKCKKRLFKFNFENARGEKNDELLQDMAVKGLLKISRVEKKTNKLPKKAEQVLDAPGLINDYYLNLIDWGKKNLLAVCLGEGAFVWNPASQEGRQFFTSENSLMVPTSIAWSHAVGPADFRTRTRSQSAFQRVRCRCATSKKRRSSARSTTTGHASLPFRGTPASGLSSPPRAKTARSSTTTCGAAGASTCSAATHKRSAD